MEQLALGLMWPLQELWEFFYLRFLVLLLAHGGSIKTGIKRCHTDSGFKRLLATSLSHLYPRPIRMVFKCDTI